jgi:ATP synthase protein I
VLRHLGRQQAAKILKAQLAITLLVAVVFGLWQGFPEAYSALCGGVICVLANFFFFHQAFKASGAIAAQKIVRGFLLGQASKFVITLALFVAAFMTGQVQPLPLFLGYVFTQAAFWLAPFLLKQRVQTNE